MPEKQIDFVAPSPEMFAEAMRGMVTGFGKDVEQFHICADSYLVRVLTALGYGEGAKIFDDANKWYS